MTEPEQQIYFLKDWLSDRQREYRQFLADHADINSSGAGYDRGYLDAITSVIEWVNNPTQTDI